MKHAFCVTLTLATLLLAGCSSTPTEVNKGPIHASTFSFIDPGARPAPSFADNQQALHTLIQNSITRTLAAKGLQQVSTNADVIVAYLVIVGNNASTAAISTYFGYGRNADALHDKAQAAYTDSKNPNYFEAGTLLVDIIDAKTYKLLKRSHVTRPLLRNPSAEAQADRIQEVVDAVLADVKIGH